MKILKTVMVVIIGVICIGMIEKMMGVDEPLNTVNIVRTGLRAIWGIYIYKSIRE